MGRSVLAAVTLLLCGCPDAATDAVFEWRAGGRLADVSDGPPSIFQALGGPRDLPEVEPLQGEWAVEGPESARELIGLGGGGRLRFDGTHAYAAPGEDGGLVLYALRPLDGGGLAARAWLLPGGRTTPLPYCVRLKPAGGGWEMTLSFLTGLESMTEEEQQNAVRSLPIRAADGDGPCEMLPAAPTLRLRPASAPGLEEAADDGVREEPPLAG